MWGQSLIASPVLPSPTSWGWMKTADNIFEPNWITLLRPVKLAMS